MSNIKCLVCSENLEAGEYHARCAKRLFGDDKAPSLDLSPETVETWAKLLVNQRLAVPGVQRKLSVDITNSDANSGRITIVGVLGGTHILKPPASEYPEMPELEHLTMQLARICGIKTADHGLIAMQGGELAYIVRRFDRYGRHKKLATEDLCQLSELPADQKYKSSCERAGKVIRKFSHNPGDDALRFFEVVVFSFLVGNSDMHLKNYSLQQSKQRVWSLSPAYDLVATQLLIADSEESALTINGKKSNLKKADFVALGRSLQIPEIVITRCINKQLMLHEQCRNAIQKSFLSASKKEEFCQLLHTRSALLNNSQ